jgi:hypothetical protein
VTPDSKSKSKATLVFCHCRDDRALAMDGQTAEAQPALRRPTIICRSRGLNDPQVPFGAGARSALESL